MPTGYTAGIIDGTVNTFKEYASLCIRNFGVAIHVRDEPFNKPFEMRVINPYHHEHLESAKLELKYIKGLTDDEIITKMTNEIVDEIARYDEYIARAKDTKLKLDEMRVNVVGWIPPTD